MKKTRDEHAERFSAKAPTYDGSHTPTYEACASLTVDKAMPTADETVLDLGAGTGAIGLTLATDAGEVVLRDISQGMLDQARQKAADRELENVAIGPGSFREPEYDDSADVVVSNFALHHLSDAEKREAIATMAEYGPRRIVLGDVMFFAAPDSAASFYNPEVDDPATVGTLVEAFTDVGYAIVAAEAVADQAGVLAAVPIPEPAASRNDADADSNG